MKKLITLLLVLCAGVMNVSADDYIAGSWDEWANPVKFSYNTDGIGSATVSLTKDENYTFKFINSSTWYGNGGTMESGNRCGWQFRTDGGNTSFTPSTTEDHKFVVQWIEVSGTWYPYIRLRRRRVVNHE